MSNSFKTYQKIGVYIKLILWYNSVTIQLWRSELIIIDYSAIALASVFINKTNDEELIRHMVLNTIRMYRTKFKEEYGEVVLAVDGMGNWRKELFPQYKANRKKQNKNTSASI